MRIALVGNQNSGKTTLFNLLTGTNQKVGNWPGVTIERKVGFIRGTDFEIIDLPASIRFRHIRWKKTYPETFYLKSQST
jgi:Fe2+ transport system protein B